MARPRQISSTAIPNGRKRTLSPNFFKDEALLSLEPYDRLLFAGLFCYCDRAGRVLDRPIELKIRIFPADNVDVDAGLNRLAKKGLLRRYKIGKLRAIALKEERWREIQNIHPNEPESAIPAPPPVKSRASAGVLVNQNRAAAPVSPSGSSGSSGSSITGSSGSSIGTAEQQWFSLVDDRESAADYEDLPPGELIAVAKREMEADFDDAIFWPQNMDASSGGVDECRRASEVLNGVDRAKFGADLFARWASMQPDLEAACREYLSCREAA